MNLQYVVVINYSQIVGHTSSKFYSPITWYYITRRPRGSVVCCQVSVIYITGRRRKGKGLVGPHRYNYYSRVESESDDPDYLGHLGHFFCGVSGSHPQTKLSGCDPDF